MSNSNKQILRYRRLFTLPMKVIKTSTVTLFLKNTCLTPVRSLELRDITKGAKTKTDISGPPSGLFQLALQFILEKLQNNFQCFN